MRKMDSEAMSKSCRKWGEESQARRPVQSSDQAVKRTGLLNFR